MMDCISVETMRQSDAYTIANFIPSLELMHRAAYGVYLAGNWEGRTAIVAGSGNNGGDGFALACILAEQGFDCTVFTLSDRLSLDSAYYASRAEEASIDIRSFEPNCLKGYDTVVDCLLGTGFHGTLRDQYRSAIEAINASGSFVVSVDINSGMNGDTGEAELAVISDLTVTVGYVKHGLIKETAGKFIKKLVCADIGIVLVREEAKISGRDEKSLPDCLMPPQWLNMKIISVKDNIKNYRN